MKRKAAVVLVMILVFVSAVGMTGCSKYAKYELKPADQSVEAPKDGEVAQLTVEDIQAMNDGNATIVFREPDENGKQYVSFINGKYYEEKVEDQEDAVKSLQGIAKLIGFSKGSEFFANFAERDSYGNTYWVLQQRYGSSTVQYGTIRVVVGPDGYVIGLSSSAIPNIGIAPEESGIGAETAIETVKAYMEEAFPSEDYKLFEDKTQELVTEYFGDGNFYHVYAVYTTNPNVKSNTTFDLPYLQHLVSFEGSYLFNNATDTMAPGETPDATNTEVYFENLEGDFWEGDVTLHDGSELHIKVPVAKSTKDGTYYLADVDRKILMADWNAFMKDFSLDFITSETNDGWKDYMLLQMYNYGRAYDFYAQVGVQGPDTFGTPMLILTDWTENGAAVENACCYGNIKGWMAFGASNDYYFEQSLDVLAHEFTHGVTGTEMLGSKYENETGAINEAMSDIMGEICEQMAKKEDGTPEVDDDLWYHGQGKPEPGRCMSDPNLFGQPACVGDLYYIIPSKNADSFNDEGGNHFNSSLLNYVAWKLFDKGLPLEDERDLWYRTICLMTPLSDYDDVFAALEMSAEINGLDPKWTKLIKETWDEIGLTGDRLANAYAYEREGCGRLAVQVDLADENTKISRITPYLYNLKEDTFTSTLYWLVPDDNGWIYGLLPDGEYTLELIASNLDGTQGSIYYLQVDGTWSGETDKLGYVQILHGNVEELEPIK